MKRPFFAVTGNRQSPGRNLACGLIWLAALGFFAGLTRAAEPGRVYVHTAAKGDTFGKLAQRLLIDRKNWPLLVKFNPTVNPQAIPVGSVIKVPVTAMRTEVASPTVVAVRGEVSVNGGKLADGQRLNERDKVSTGGDGFVTIKLADGSTLTVQSKSAIEIERARLLADTRVGESIIRLASGRLETSVTRQNPAARYEVRTPTSNMGVRGTVFRAGADLAGKKALSEVLEGAVGVSGTTTDVASGLAINAGFGTIVEDGRPPSPPIKLLPAPQLVEIVGPQPRADVAIRFLPVAGANGYRVLAALDKDFLRPVAETVTGVPTAILAKLPDGELFVRVRAIDGIGLEGDSDQKPFTVAARPFAPAYLVPVAGSQVNAGRVVFKWVPQKLTDTAVAELSPPFFRLQIARDARFVDLLLDQKNIAAITLTTPQPLAPGRYFWRVASNSTAREGPFGDAQSFTVRASALVITPIGSVSDARFRWQGEPGQSYQYQISRRESFTELVQDRVIADSQLKLEGLAKNTYFIRVRAVGAASTPADPVNPGEWSATQAVEIYSGVF